MENLYAKLYDKYAKLKEMKFGELELINKDQEEKFINYMTAAEELMQRLKDENDSLRSRLDELISSTRHGASVGDQSSEYQKLLIEEINKNKQLSKEVDKLQKLQKKGVSNTAEPGDGERGLLNSLVAPQNGSDTSNEPLTRSKRKRTRLPEVNEESVPSPQDNGRTKMMQLLCCRRPTGELDDKSTGECLFQALVQYTLGMQFSIVVQAAGVCISAVHESSGYSFSLSLANKEASGEVELMYTVQSLGTYERVAPEWMREVIKFSTNMCPVFFDRISRFIDVRH